MDGLSIKTELTTQNSLKQFLEPYPIGLKACNRLCGSESGMQAGLSLLSDSETAIQFFPVSTGLSLINLNLFPSRPLL
jgi:hypothetical protein